MDIVVAFNSVVTQKQGGNLGDLGNQSSEIRTLELVAEDFKLNEGREELGIWLFGVVNIQNKLTLSRLGRLGKLANELMAHSLRLRLTRSSMLSI